MKNWLANINWTEDEYCRQCGTEMHTYFVTERSDPRTSEPIVMYEYKVCPAGSDMLGHSSIYMRRIDGQPDWGCIGIGVIVLLCLLFVVFTLVVLAAHPMWRL